MQTQHRLEYLPLWTWSVQVDEDFFKRQTKLFKSDVSTMSVRAAMVGVHDDLWARAIDMAAAGAVGRHYCFTGSCSWHVVWMHTNVSWLAVAPQRGSALTRYQKVQLCELFFPEVRSPDAGYSMIQQTFVGL